MPGQFTHAYACTGPPRPAPSNTSTKYPGDPAPAVGKKASCPSAPRCRGGEGGGEAAGRCACLSSHAQGSVEGRAAARLKRAAARSFRSRRLPQARARARASERVRLTRASGRAIVCAHARRGMRAIPRPGGAPAGRPAACARSTKRPFRPASGVSFKCPRQHGPDARGHAEPARVTRAPTGAGPPRSSPRVPLPAPRARTARSASWRSKLPHSVAPRPPPRSNWAVRALSAS